MKSLLIAAIAMVGVVSPSHAEEPLLNWQTAALEKVKEYSRVKGAQWQDKRLLWLFAYDADISWNNIADQVSCNHLRSAGMPDNSKVMVAFYDQAEAAQGKAKRLGYAVCN